jgi:hypothetical protein
VCRPLNFSIRETVKGMINTWLFFVLGRQNRT